MWVSIFKNLLFSWVNLIFAPRKLTSLAMYQETSQKRGPKSVKSKDKRLWAPGPVGQRERGAARPYHPLMHPHGPPGKGLDDCDLQ